MGRTSPLKMRPKSAKIYRVMSKAAFLFLLQICFSGGCRAKRFDIENENDIMVYLHIQKTGGTYFNRALIKDIEGYECQQTEIPLCHVS